MLAAANCVIFDCSYSTTDRGYGAGSVYTCQVTVSTLDNNEAITAVTDSSGSATSGLTTSDVKQIILANSWNVRVARFPSNLATIFPNLIGIEWTGSHLKTIKLSDLSPFPNLVHLIADSNMI